MRALAKPHVNNHRYIRSRLLPRVGLAIYMDQFIPHPGQPSKAKQNKTKREAPAAAERLGGLAASSSVEDEIAKTLLLPHRPAIQANRRPAESENPFQLL